MNIRKISLFLVIIIPGLLYSQIPYKAQTGDLLFQDLDCGEFCNAIEKVTTGVDNKSFSHVGMVYTENDSVFVLEAGSKGVVKTPFKSFLNRSFNSEGKPKVVVGRVLPTYSYLIPGAVSKAISLLGRKYDDAFDISNDQYYCSELVYYAFMDTSGNSLFKLYPMTFIDPDTHQTFPAWVDYFKNLKIPIPEGKPGLNPGGISRSDKITIVYSFY